MTEAVMGVVRKIEDASASVDVEIAALTTYVQHIFVVREVAKERKQWEDGRQKKVSKAIALAMKQWDAEHSLQEYM